MLFEKAASRTICTVIAMTACLTYSSVIYAQDNASANIKSAVLYPIDVEEKTENDYGVIIRTYALKPNENPDDIPINGFDKYGASYELAEIIKKENRSEDRIAHTETITLNTQNNDMNEILKQLSQEMPYDKDGYAGKLTLDISSVICEPAGYKTNTYTLTAKREYPNLSSNDTSLIPKTVTEKGVTYSIADVSFKPHSENSIDYTPVPSSYTAYATYTANNSSKKITGYVTTAEYNGEITRTLTNETIYKAYFISEEAVIDPEPITEAESVVPAEMKEPKPDMESGWVFPIISVLLTLLSGGAAVILFIRFSNNTAVYSKHGVEYKKIGRLKVNYKADTPAVNLTKFAPKAASEVFIIELSKQGMKNLLGRNIETNDIQVSYKEKLCVHTVAPYAAADKYQFEISFDEDKGEDFYEEK